MYQSIFEHQEYCLSGLWTLKLKVCIVPWHWETVLHFICFMNYLASLVSSRKSLCTPIKVRFMCFLRPKHASRLR